MAVKKTSRDIILKHAIKLFKIQGYYNTSMANIAEACGLIKGSIYHHFKSKEEIGLESLKYIHRYFQDHIYNIAYDSQKDARERLDLLVQKTDAYFLHSEGGCLLGNLALEVASQNSTFKEEIREYFDNWVQALRFILSSRYSAEQSDALAQEAVALTQGAIMMMTLYGSSINYLKVGRKIMALLP